MLSIITPVYNGDRFIESCIQNVISQNCDDVEHIIIDGGSSDKTVEIIQCYADQYPHIRWISEQDKGQSDAMNKGIALARGEILGVLNVDDYYEPNILNHILDLFDRLPEPTFLAGNCNVWNTKGNLDFVNKPKNIRLSELLLGFKANQFPVNPSAYFYHKSLHKKIDYFDIEEHYAMDLDFLLRAVQAANIQYVDETWGNFRMLEGTKTVNDKRNDSSRIRKEQLFRLYRKDLPIFQRWQVVFGYTLYKAWGTAEYLVGEPQEFFPIVNRQIKKLVKFSI